jgi:Protein of unknown function with PCYCGC motif
MSSKTLATVTALLALTIAPAPQRAASRPGTPASSLFQNGPEEPVPAFHTQPPQGALPDTMDPSLFSDIVVQNAYRVAARVKRVLYQQPCYCHCDRSQGHGSLLDCFASRHGSGCDICIREDFYAYEQSRKGKTAKQIREGIEQGQWQQVNVSKYQAPLTSK